MVDSRVWERLGGREDWSFESIVWKGAGPPGVAVAVDVVVVVVDVPVDDVEVEGEEG